MLINKHIYKDPVKCVKELFKACVPNFSLIGDDYAILSQLSLAEPVICQCIDESLWEWICNIAQKSSDERSELECKILKQARLTISLYIAHLFIQTPGLITDSGDFEGEGNKISNTTFDKNKRNCWVYLNRYYDALEVLIFKCLCPNLAAIGIENPEQLKMVKKFCRYFIQSPAQFVECETLTVDGRLSVFLKIQTYFKIAEYELRKCLCPDFFDLLKSVYCKPNFNEVTIYDELIALMRAYIANYSKYMYDQKDAKTATNNGMQYVGKHPYPLNRRVYESEVNKSDLRYQQAGGMYLQLIDEFLNTHKNDEGFEVYLSCIGDADDDIEIEDCKVSKCACGRNCACTKSKLNLINGDDGMVFI